MTPTLSVLDPSPIFKDRTAADALNETRALASAADGMRYRSYWVQEHHNATSFAGTTPEILMADLAARTSRIILGSGGIMLPNYSPLKVAEWGQTLSQLYPGRIEIGLGRATGADPRTSAALLGPGGQNFPTMLRMLMDWLLDASGAAHLPDDHRARGIAANPKGPGPDLWMLCSSPASAAFAGQMGLKLAFADFLNPGGAKDALDAYHQAFEPSPFCAKPHAAIGLVVLAAETEAEAERLSAPIKAWALSRGAGQFQPYLSTSEAEAYLAKAPLDPPQRGIIGSGLSVAQHLSAIARETHACEFFLLSITDHIETRINSYRLIETAMAEINAMPTSRPEAG
ncbi:MAG: MsnO8 family LLM class oxidoreductase [Hyphomonadaceae bacterium]|nr:MsnO8 family LLM class oxidoreductase [Hyphomonadaceae bacterium]